MIARASAALIVGFWLVMMGLLWRVEFAGDQSILSLPIASLARLAFANEQATSYGIFKEQVRIGSLILRPGSARAPSDPRYSLQHNGSLGFADPDRKANRVAWSGRFDFDRELQVLEVALDLQSTNPQAHLDLQSTPRNNKTTVRLLDPEGRVQLQLTGSWQELLGQLQLEGLGITPQRLESYASRAGEARISAVRSTLTLSGERIPAFLVTIEHAPSLESHVYLSEQGQLLLVRSFLGYRLIADDIDPAQL